MATLSIASESADGILIWRKIDSPVVEEYLSRLKDPEYLTRISIMEKLQIKDERIWKEANPMVTNSSLFQGYCHF